MTSSFNILSVDQAEYVRNNSICRIAERIHSDYEYQGTEIPHKTTRNSISKMFTTLAHQRLKKIHCKEHLQLTNIKNPANDHVTYINLINHSGHFCGIRYICKHSGKYYT